MERINRRQVFRQAGLGALGTGALAVLSSVPASADNGNNIVGTWDAIFRATKPPEPHLELLLAFTAGGEVVEADASAASPSLGAWIAAEEDVVFSFKSWSFNPDGSLAGTARTNCRGSVHERALTGSFHFLAYDTTGKLVFEDQGTFSGNPFVPRYP